jgi:hypothetical protein
MMPTEPIIFSMLILGVPIIVLMCVVIGYLYEPTNNEPITTAIGVFVLVARSWVMELQKLLGVL